MSEESELERKRLHFLLSERALRELEVEQRDELLELARLHPDVDGWEYEVVAAEVHLARLAGPLDELPAGLMQALEAQAEGFAAGPSAAGPSAAGPSAAGPSAAGPSEAGPSEAGPSELGQSQPGESASRAGASESRAHAAGTDARTSGRGARATGRAARGARSDSRGSRSAARSELGPVQGTSRGKLFAWSGWTLAAASLMLAAFLSREQTAMAPTVAEARAELMASARDLATVPWNATEDPLVAGREIGGEVVWSDAREEGYMRFQGLPLNDPSVAQYQLWIFDKERSAEQPVDGGVFDVTSEGEVIVPIDAKLPVGEAFLFGVTLERPGGVVVSAREHLVLLAQM